MTSLYQLVDLYKRDAAQLEDLDIDDQTIADTLEGMRGELEVKATNVAMLVRNLESTASAIKDAESQMASRRKAIENRVTRIRQYLLDSMVSAGIEKIEHPMLRLSVRKNPPSVDVFDAAQVPADYWREPPPPPKSIDKTLIGRAIKNGHEVPGAKLNQTLRLEIR